MITNPRRRKQIEYFCDKDHKAMSKYYELIESWPSRPQFKKILRELIQEDQNFFDPYLTLADILFEEGKDREAENMIFDAYQKAVHLIVDKNGNWPKEMEWGWLENRHIMRAIEYYAYLCWEGGKFGEALENFRRLLKMNPGDNQGARHSILAIRLGLDPDYEKKFFIKKGPMAGQAMEAGLLFDWFDKNAKKFPEEFNWLHKEWKRRFH